MNGSQVYKTKGERYIKWLSSIHKKVILYLHFDTRMRRASDVGIYHSEKDMFTNVSSGTSFQLSMEVSGRKGSE